MNKSSIIVSQSQKIIRILRLKVTDKPGFLAKVTSVIGEAQVNIGEITIIGQGPDFILREFSLQLIDIDHLNAVIYAIEKIDGISVESIIDPVEQIHEGGKIAMKSRVKVDSLTEMRKIYTPGVAQICKLIERDITLSRKYTGIGNTVAIVTNGSAVLGLGNIGAVAGMPVMEGKSVLFDCLVGISAIPILIDSQDPQVIINTVKAISCTFGAIQLEDIKAPECFEIEQTLINELAMPIMHDDQHATAVVALSALKTIALNTGIDLNTCKIGIIGLGAAGIGITRLLKAALIKDIIGCDLRSDAIIKFEEFGGKSGDLNMVMNQADIVIATTGVPQLIKPNMVRPGQIILALSNPVPEIDPELAMQQGAKFAADGRTINNALAYPGIFHGALRSKATCITDNMKLAAAEAISLHTKTNNLVPSILDYKVHQSVADAVSLAWFQDLHNFNNLKS